MDISVPDIATLEDENVKPILPNLNTSDADSGTPAKRRRVSKLKILHL